MPGEVVFVHEGDEPCKPRRGPRFKYKYRSAAALDDDAETMSDSKRSTVNQSTFKQYLIYRDGTCLLSGAMFNRCTASHILPQSRPEDYCEVLGIESPWLFMPAYGLLLRDDLHHCFDRGEIALYPQGDDLIVHVFTSSDASLGQFHGKVIPSARFFRPPADAWPDKRLLAFHYRQCAMKHLRGFSSGMEPPTT